MPADHMTPFQPWLVELRVAYWFLTGPEHAVSAYVGGGAGIVTHMVPRVVFNQNMHTIPGADMTKVYEPFYKVSGWGTVALGSQYRYFLNETWAIGAELAMNAMFWNSSDWFSWNFDVLFDTTVAF